MHDVNRHWFGPSVLPWKERCGLVFLARSLACQFALDKT